MQCRPSCLNRVSESVTRTMGVTSAVQISGLGSVAELFYLWREQGLPDLKSQYLKCCASLELGEAFDRDSSYLDTFLSLPKSSLRCRRRKLGCFDVIYSFYGVFSPHLGALKCYASRQKYRLIIQIMASTAYHANPLYSLFFS